MVIFIIIIVGATPIVDNVHPTVKHVPQEVSVTSARPDTGDRSVRIVAMDVQGPVQKKLVAHRADMGFILCRIVIHAARTVSLMYVKAKMVDVLMVAKMDHTDTLALSIVCPNVRHVLTTTSAPAVKVRSMEQPVITIVFLVANLAAMVTVVTHVKMGSTVRVIHQNVNVRVKNAAHTVTAFVVPANKIRLGIRWTITAVHVLLHVKIVLAMETVHVSSAQYIDMVTYVPNSVAIDVTDRYVHVMAIVFNVREVNLEKRVNIDAIHTINYVANAQERHSQK